VNALEVISIWARNVSHLFRNDYRRVTSAEVCGLTFSSEDDDGLKFYVGPNMKA
jgi:hypothetical protein